MSPSKNELEEAKEKKKEVDKMLMNDVDEKTETNFIRKNWFYSIQNIFLRTPIHFVVPTYNNILLVHVDMPLHVGIKNLINKQLAYMLIYDKDIIGHVNQRVLLDYFIYFYNFIKYKNLEKEKKKDSTPEDYINSDPSEFTFNDILKLSSHSKKLCMFENTVDCLTVWNFFLKSNEQVVYIIDKTKNIIAATAQIRDFIFYIFMNSKGKYYELHSSASPCLQKVFIQVYEDTPLSEVLLLMHTNNLDFVPIGKRENDVYLDYFNLDDYFILCKKTFLENWSIEPQNGVISYTKMIRNNKPKYEEVKKGKSNIHPDISKSSSEHFFPVSEKSETIKHNQQFTIKNALQALFYSKISALIVLSEKNQIEGIVTFKSLFEYLQKF